jgi:large subunit ribosomal protein L24
MHVHSKDQVVVISGKDKGKKGKVLTCYPKTGRLVVEGVAMVTKHQKARAQGEKGGILHMESAIDASNVMLICNKCAKATRTAHKVTHIDLGDGKKKRKMIRVCKKCGADID